MKKYLLLTLLVGQFYYSQSEVISNRNEVNNIKEELQFDFKVFNSPISPSDLHKLFKQIINNEIINRTETMDNTSSVFDFNEKIEIKKCIDIIMEILTTSPVYLDKTKGLHEAIVKNGGTSFGITIEGSPNPNTDNAMDFSDTYDFNLHESYPERMTVTARFTFNPITKQLYEFDAAEGEFNPIAFDRNLLLKFNEICK